MREVESSDLENVSEVIRDAFSGFPWFQVFTKEKSLDWLERDFKTKKFIGFLIEVDSIIVAAYWSVLFSREDILREKCGDLLYTFISQLHCEKVVWGRSLVVKKAFQGRGLSSVLRKKMFEALEGSVERYYFTTLRTDNEPTITGAKKFGYKQTGITFPSSSDPKVVFEYWYLDLNVGLSSNT